MGLPTTAILHYTAPPVVGGVEAVIRAHVKVFREEGYPVTVVAGRGNASSLADGAKFKRVHVMDSQQNSILKMNDCLEGGDCPHIFSDMVNSTRKKIGPLLECFDNVIVHNIFSKHFNLALTAALFELLDAGKINNCIAWCHDFTWTSPSSRSKVFPGYPWDLLRTYRQDITYVTVSEARQKELSKLLDLNSAQVRVVYNGVSLTELLGLSDVGRHLAVSLGLIDSDIILLMPVRVTRAKNIEYALKTVKALKEINCRIKLILTGPPDPHEPKSMEYYSRLLSLRKQLDVEEEMRFVFEEGTDPDRGLILGMETVGELFRICDVMFLPSHREGFGMPVLEAGLMGIPVFCTDVPAADEIGGKDVNRFSTADDPTKVARRIMDVCRKNSLSRFRRRVRKQYTWRNLFHEEIKHLLKSTKSVQRANQGL
jgi:glycosyltransferase involved in cell wall biosynthesis